METHEHQQSSNEINHFVFLQTFVEVTDDLKEEMTYNIYFTLPIMRLVYKIDWIIHCVIYFVCS